MRMHPFHRTELLLGGSAMMRLEETSVCVIGLGGVGGYAAEALARSGVGHITLVDFDRVCVTNVNRQVHASRSTVGQPKADLMRARCLDVAPKADIRALELFYSEQTRAQVLDRDYDLVFDCIDNMAAKIDLIATCVERGLTVYSAMGAGGRLDPTRVRVSDLSETKVDPFARIARDLLRRRGIHQGVQCVWSDESPNVLDRAAQEGFKCICPDRMDSPHSCDQRFQVQGSVAWMPAMFGLAMAGAAVCRLLERPIHGNAPVRPERQAPAPGKPSGDRRRELLAQAGFARLPSAPSEGSEAGRPPPPREDCPSSS